MCRPEQIELVAQYGNMGIVHMPGRRFPGICIQADTVSSWLSALSEDRRRGGVGGARDLEKTLRQCIETYVSTLTDRGDEIPVVWPPP